MCTIINISEHLVAPKCLDPITEHEKSFFPRSVAAIRPELVDIDGNNPLPDPLPHKYTQEQFQQWHNAVCAHEDEVLLKIERFLS